MPKPGETNDRIRPIHATASNGDHVAMLDPASHTSEQIAAAMAANAPGNVRLLLNPASMTPTEMVAVMRAVRIAARRARGLPDDDQPLCAEVRPAKRVVGTPPRRGG